MKNIKVSFIGAGNLAWHLAPALDNTEYRVQEVYSKRRKSASLLVERLYEAQVKDSLDFSDSTSSIFIIAVSDDVIEEIANQIILPPQVILVHTSGSQPLTLLSYSLASNVGVFYPLQTFTKQRKVNFEEIPIFIESEDAQVGKVLIALGKAISKNVYAISSATRMALHVSAVFASNFTNHMLTVGKNIADENNLSFDLLKPLITETIAKSLTLGPEMAQTGPARRGDLEILDKHMEFLKEDRDVAEIYKVISQHIVNTYAT